MCQIQLYPVKPGQEVRKAFVTTYISQDQLIKYLVNLKHEWIKATNGDMQRVTLDLELLFDDLLEFAKGK